jgi:hypothetical protein
MRHDRAGTEGPVPGFAMLAQPDGSTCGPTCLHAIYRHWGDDVSLEQVVREVPSLESGGTLVVMLANHALARGYAATIYTYNLQAFDPTWFATPDVDLAERLRVQRRHKSDRRLQISTKAYLEFLERGGDVRFEDLVPGLIARIVGRGTPILAGCSATYLYRAMREAPPDDRDDDVRGQPVGHFVVVYDYDSTRRSAFVADPLFENPVRRREHFYEVPVARLLNSILLGVLTYDANFLVIRPR